MEVTGADTEENQKLYWAEAEKPREKGSVILDFFFEWRGVFSLDLPFNR